MSCRFRLEHKFFLHESHKLRNEMIITPPDNKVDGRRG